MNRLKWFAKGLRLVFPVLFNVCFFVIGGFDHPASVWISYGFIHIAYLCLVLTPKLVKPSRSSAILEYSMDLISVIYLFAQFSIGLGCFIRASIVYDGEYVFSSWKIPFLIQFVMFGVYVGVMLWNLMIKEHIEKNEAKAEVNRNYIKLASGELAAVMEMISDRSRKKSIEKVYDAMRCSQIKSNPSVVDLEDAIMRSINYLREIANTDDDDKLNAAINGLMAQITDRDRRLKFQA